MEAWQQLILIYSVVIVLATLTVIITSWFCKNRYRYFEIKKYIKKNRTFEDWEIDRVEFKTEKEYELTKQLLKDSNYELVEESEVVDEHIFGIGTVEYADGTIQYDVYTSRDCLYKIDPKYLDYYKEHLGQTIQRIQINKVYKRVDK